MFVIARIDGPAGRDGAHMRVLGVDPGLTRCGLGVVEGVPGKPPGLVAAGVARTPPSADIAARLLALEVEIDSWLAEHHPDAVAVERVFSQHNVRTVMGTAQAGAVAVLCAARRGLPVALHTPSEVKAAVTGSGRADKAQVTTMVMRLLRLADPPKPADTADALALAICHLWRGPQTRLAVLARGGDPPDPPSWPARRGHASGAPPLPEPAGGDPPDPPSWPARRGHASGAPPLPGPAGGDPPDPPDPRIAAARRAAASRRGNLPMRTD